MKAALLLAVFSLMSLQGQVVYPFYTEFNFEGKAGPGLLPLNVVPPVGDPHPSSSAFGWEANDPYPGGAYHVGASGALVLRGGFSNLEGSLIAMRVYASAQGTGFYHTGSYLEDVPVADLGNGSYSFDYAFVHNLPGGDLQLFTGSFYVAVETTAYPYGELRANLVAVPEPSAYIATFAAGLAGFVAVRRLVETRK